MIKIVKTTADYQISETPHPKCIVRTDEPLSNSHFILFPNPANGFIHIESKEEIHRYKVFTASSELLMTANPNAKEFTVDLDLVAGAYLIVLESDVGVYSQKFLIVR